MMNPDDAVPKNTHEVSLFFTLAAMAGGLLWGMIRITAVVGGPAPYDRSDVVKASIDAVLLLLMREQAKEGVRFAVVPASERQARYESAKCRRGPL